MILCGIFMVVIAFAAMYFGKMYLHWVTAPEPQLICGDGLILRGSICISQNAVIETPQNLRETNSG
jgi:hypothetical protein